MAVFELACLARLRRLSLVRVHKITDLAVCALAEQASQLERLHLSYCDQLSLDSIHLLLRKSRHLQHLTATGVPAFRRQGVHRFSDPPPPVSPFVELRCSGLFYFCESLLDFDPRPASSISSVHGGQGSGSPALSGQRRAATTGRRSE
jgi:hypothetical protein